MLLLKDSLKGRAEIAVKRIQLVPKKLSMDDKCTQKEGRISAICRTPYGRKKILGKLPYSIVKSVLISTQDQEETKIEDIMEELEKQIDAEKYVESRLRNFTTEEHPKITMEFTRNEQDNSNTNECVFCNSETHVASNCVSVTDI
ncbi:hypothetical protein Aduo_017556 [Ancylostoma duodenale]